MINVFCVNVRAVKTGRSNLTESANVRLANTNTTQRLNIGYMEMVQGCSVYAMATSHVLLTRLFYIVADIFIIGLLLETQN